MRVSYKYLSNAVVFDDRKAKIIAIENKELFRNTVMELYLGNPNELFVFSKNFSPVSFDKKVRFIGDVLNFNYNDKKLITKIYSDIENIVNDMYYENILRIKEQMICLCDKITERMEFDVDFDDNIETLSLIKACSFSLKDDSDSPLEKLLRFIKLTRDYLGIEFFVMQNLCLYFSESQMETFLRNISIEKFNIIDIEHTVPDLNIESADSADVIIIDNDFCVVDNQP